MFEARVRRASMFFPGRFRIFWSARACRTPKAGFVEKRVCERRIYSSRRAGADGVAGDDVPGGVGQQTSRPRHDLRQDAQALGAPDRRRPREDGDVALRFEQSAHHLAVKVGPFPVCGAGHTGQRSRTSS